MTLSPRLANLLPLELHDGFLNRDISSVVIVANDFDTGAELAAELNADQLIIELTVADAVFRSSRLLCDSLAKLSLAIPSVVPVTRLYVEPIKPRCIVPNWLEATRAKFPRLVKSELPDKEQLAMAQSASRLWNIIWHYREFSAVTLGIMAASTELQSEQIEMVKESLTSVTLSTIKGLSLIHI